MVSTSTVPYYEGVADYIKLGYIPLEKSGTAASSTLEYAYDDFTIYRAALKAGHRELADVYRKRALNYRNLYDPSIGFAARAWQTAPSSRSSTYCKPTAKLHRRKLLELLLPRAPRRAGTDASDGR